MLICFLALHGQEHTLYLDSGCSRHMTWCKYLLKDFVEKDDCLVMFGDNHKQRAMGFGSFIASIWISRMFLMYQAWDTTSFPSVNFLMLVIRFSSAKRKEILWILGTLSCSILSGRIIFMCLISFLFDKQLLLCAFSMLLLSFKNYINMRNLL